MNRSPQGVSLTFSLDSGTSKYLATWDLTDALTKRVRDGACLRLCSFVVTDPAYNGTIGVVVDGTDYGTFSASTAGFGMLFNKLQFYADTDPGTLQVTISIEA